MYETTRETVHICKQLYSAKQEMSNCLILTVAEVSLTSFTKSTTESKLHSPLLAASSKV